MTYYLNLSFLSNNLNNLQKTEHKKRLSNEARRILSQCEGRTLTDGDIAREKTGRPFFPGSDIDFSISHSGALAAVSLVRGKGLRTGCDVELVRPRARAKEIAEDFFTAPEKVYIESRGSFDITRFYQIWTLKECFLKLRGLSVFNMSGVPSFINGEKPEIRNPLRGQFVFSPTGSSPISFSLYELTGNAGERYILATTIEPQLSLTTGQWPGECSPLTGTEIEQPEIRWFSQKTLDCISIVNINATMGLQTKFVPDIVA